MNYSMFGGVLPMKNATKLHTSTQSVDDGSLIVFRVFSSSAQVDGIRI